MEIYALNKDLNTLGAIQAKSLIWIPRYNRVGSCEVYAPATKENVALLKTGNYIRRSDRDDMVCRIEFIKRSGNQDEGEFITALGYDAKILLDNRVNKDTDQLQSSQAGAAVEAVVVANCINATDTQRNFVKSDSSPLLALFSSGLTAEITQRILYMSVGEVCRQVCGSLGWGYRFRIVNSETYPYKPYLLFELYAGTERAVTFSREFANLGNTEYEHDIRQLGNVIICNGDTPVPVNGELGSGSGVDRVERYAQTNYTLSIRYGELKNLFQMSYSLSQGANDTAYFVGTDIYIPILSPWHLANLQANASSGHQEGDYWYIPTQLLASAADTQVSDVTDDTVFTMRWNAFVYVLLSGSVEYANEYKELEYLNAEILDNTFVYNQDYYLGDIVTVVTDYGEDKARIVEVMECFDENGYHLEPRTSYTDVDES